MKRFIITSPRYTGQAEVVYNDKDILCRIDCSDTNMDVTTVEHFKKVVAPHLSILGQNMSKDTIIIEAEFEVSYAMFWKKYDKKINNKRCMMLWDKMEKSMQVAAYFGIDAYNKYLKRESWRSKADPETYLRNRYWENEYK